MKKARNTLALILAVVMSVIAGIPVLAHDAGVSNVNASVYSVEPGTAEWNNMKTFSQKLAACRIPQKTLGSMTTDELVDAVVEFPFLINLMVYDSLDVGFENLLRQSDAMKELLTRTGAADALAQKYISLTAKLETASSIDGKIELSRSALYPDMLEIILGQPEVYNAMSVQYQYAIERAAANYNDGEISMLDLAISEHENQITRVAVTVWTPMGSPVTGDDRTNMVDWDAADKATGNAWVQSLYSVEILRDPTKRYNCHSYAWYSTATTNKIWINDPSAYMTDGSYDQQASPAVSDKAFIRNNGSETNYYGEILGDHSGIVTAVSGSSVTLTSKWGMLGLYRHSAYDSPYSGDHTMYSYWD